jgi:hypothetical protein
VTAVKLYYDCPSCLVTPRAAQNLFGQGIMAKDTCHVTAVRITFTVILDFDKLTRSPQEELGAPSCPLCQTLMTYEGFDLPSSDDGESR